MTDEAITLKPCPFCGEQCAGLVIDQGDKWAHYEPGCLEVRTGYKTGLDEPWRTEAIAAWNTRTPGIQVSNLVSAARALLDASERHIFGDECLDERTATRDALAAFQEASNDL